MAAAGAPVASARTRAGGNGGTVCGNDVFLFHQKLDFVSLSLGAGAVCDTVHSSVVAADDLLFGSFAAYLIITDTETDHIYAHISRRFVRTGTIDAFKNSI